MSYREKLKQASSRKDLAALLGYKPSALTAIIYKSTHDQNYTTFNIPKKDGGVRVIKAPSEKLKKLQSHLANYLYGCLSEIEEEKGLNPVSFGFRRDRSIIENASRHKNRRWVLNLDLQDFFPSINFGRVRGYFLKDKNFSLNPEVATTLAQIACDGKALPQGSPCSPVISELIGQMLDMRLIKAAKKHGLRYTRYADDITFSTNQAEFPEEIAFQVDHDPENWSIGEYLENKILSCGFSINKNKTRMQFRGSRQSVTGLVVNEKVNVSSEFYRKIRAMCDSLFSNGEYFRKEFDSDSGEFIDSHTDNMSPLEGMLSYAYYVTQHSDKRDLKYQRSEPRALRALYRRFLFYKYCINLSAPLIVTEGKTDTIYLRAAISNLSQNFPSLIKKDNDESKYLVNFFNYEGQAHEIMDLGGGTGDLKSIILDYLKNLYPSRNARKPMLSTPMKFPVIILLDNDGGLSSVASTIRANFDIRIDKNTTDDFYHITDNLYLIKVPESGGNDVSIEDLLPKKWLSKKLNNKKFSKDNKYDNTTHYGKEIFARYVVAPNSSAINFSGFSPLLKRIDAAISHYAKSL